MVRLQLRLILAGGALLAAAVAVTAACGDPLRPSKQDDPLRPSRLWAVSRRYLGVPYRRDCLGEEQAPDRDPLFSRTRADCQSLVEQVLAECLASRLGGLDGAIRALRYRDGAVHLAARHHFCLPDWLEHPWPARDVTAALGCGPLTIARRRLSPAALLRRLGVQPGPRTPQTREIAIRFLPRAAAARRPGRITDGSIVVFLSPRPDQAAGHLGFVFQTRAGVVLRHASRTKGGVADESLPAYLTGAGRRWPGIVVLKPDATRLGLPGL